MEVGDSTNDGESEENGGDNSSEIPVDRRSVDGGNSGSEEDNHDSLDMDIGRENFGNSRNDGESEENRDEIGVERVRVDGGNSGTEVGNEDNSNTLDIGSVGEGSGNSANNGLREDNGGGNLIENADQRSRVDCGNSGNDRADSGENGNGLSDKSNGNQVDRHSEDGNGDNGDRDTYGGGQLDSTGSAGGSGDAEGEHSGRNQDKSLADKPQYFCKFCTADFYIYRAYMMHVENAHPEWRETIEEEFRNSQSVDYQVQMIAETELDSTVAVLDDNNEDECTLVE